MTLLAWPRATRCMQTEGQVQHSTLSLGIGDQVLVDSAQIGEKLPRRSRILHRSSGQ